MFDRREPNFSERQCLEWVKKITARPEPEAPPDAEAQFGDDANADSGPLPMRKLRKLFANESKRAAAGKAAKASRP